MVVLAVLKTYNETGLEKFKSTKFFFSASMTHTIVLV